MVNIMILRDWRILNLFFYLSFKTTYYLLHYINFLSLSHLILKSLYGTYSLSTFASVMSTILITPPDEVSRKHASAMQLLMKSLASLRVMPSRKLAST